MSETVTTENSPPSIPIENYPTGYPSPKRKLGQAWAAAWAELSTLPDEDYEDGVLLAKRTADAAGLKDTTMISLLTRAATAGLLERKLMTVATGRGPRQRTHYRIPRAS